MLTPEQRITKLEENMLVQTELMVRLERHGEEFEKKVEDWIESAEIRMAEFKAVSTAVLERIDKFIAGREGNGQH